MKMFVTGEVKYKAQSETPRNFMVLIFIQIIPVAMSSIQQFNISVILLLRDGFTAHLTIRI